MSFESMPPWESARYFENPVSTVTGGSGPGFTTKVIAPADPNRVTLIISAIPGGGNVVVGPNPNLDNTGGGITLTASVPVYEVRFATHGPMVTLAWYGSLSSVAGVTTIEHSLKAWPRRRYKYGKATITDAIDYLSRGERYPDRGSPTKEDWSSD